jgi:hypothetical protein
MYRFTFSWSRLGRSDRFTPGERAPGTHWIGSWVDHRGSLDDVEKIKFEPYRDSNSDPSVVQPVASRYTDYAIPAACITTIQNCNFINIRKRHRISATEYVASALSLSLLELQVVFWCCNPLM